MRREAWKHIVGDLIIFIICMYHIWGLFKVKLEKKLKHPFIISTAGIGLHRNFMSFFSWKFSHFNLFLNQLTFL